MTEQEFRKMAKKSGWTDEEIEDEIRLHNQSGICLPYEEYFKSFGTLRTYEVGEDGRWRDVEKSF